HLGFEGHRRRSNRLQVRAGAKSSARPAQYHAADRFDLLFELGEMGVEFLERGRIERVEFIRPVESKRAQAALVVSENAPLVHVTASAPARAAIAWVVMSGA